TRRVGKRAVPSRIQVQPRELARAGYLIDVAPVGVALERDLVSAPTPVGAEPHLGDIRRIAHRSAVGEHAVAPIGEFAVNAIVPAGFELAAVSHGRVLLPVAGAERRERALGLVGWL